MKTTLRNKILTEYPDWHRNPLRLTVPEMQNPQSVVVAFFETYNLPAIRACLKEWLEDALKAPGTCAIDHIHTNNDVERLIEATFLLQVKQPNQKKK